MNTIAKALLCSALMATGAYLVVNGYYGGGMLFGFAIIPYFEVLLSSNK
jgi:hypothetical protein